MKINQTKHPGRFRFISLGDVHLGHHQTPTTKIIQNLDKYCTNDRVLKDVDLLIITGDLYDRLLHNADENVHHINAWITRLLYRCAYLDVVLRIVEGTPSHDRGQPRFFLEQAVNAKVKLDLHYASKLEIEYIERFGIHVLYIPDKWRSDSNETYNEARLEMKKQGIDKVDFVIMHGAFEYQLPSIVKEPTHDSPSYLAMVRYFILIGHVHLRTRLDRILAAGSYDRICHNEENPKGYYDVTVRAEDDHDVVFVPNSGAKRYITVECAGLDTKELNVTVRNAVDGLPKGSAVRLRSAPTDAAAGDLSEWATTYPHYDWTFAAVKSEAQRTSVLDSFLKTDMAQFANITPESIESLAVEELKRQGVSEAHLLNCTRRLKEIVSGLH